MQFDFKQTSNRDIYNLINGLVAPRPIALVTSLSPEGRLNAAPFSAYNYLCTNPPIVGLGIAGRPKPDPRRADEASGLKGAVPFEENGTAARNTEADELKDTSCNIELTHEFVINVVTEDIAQKMNLCGIEFPPEVSELEMAGFTTAPSLVVKVPRIKEAHAALECRLYETLKPRGSARIILGEVIAAYVEDQYIDPEKHYIKAQDLHAIGRMNSLNWYVKTEGAFISIPRLNYEQWLKGEGH
jgi:flavin reductase (DIM6/NTAB) family NADH-FMN oxidoreductase RutF